MIKTHLRLALVLGLITAVGPFAIDMYLPALPSIGGALHASPGMVQMTLTIFFVVSGVCQLVFGPLSDMFGRKRPIYAGLVIFGVASVGCALSRNIETLIFFRAMQAFGGCAGSVAPRAVVRDVLTGADAARLMALLMLVFSVSPILAPVTGSAVIAVFGWRGVFWVVAVAAVIALIMAVTLLKETRPPELRRASSWRTAVTSYGVLLRDPRFVGLVLVSAFSFSAFVVYLANASFVIIGHFGLTPTQFSLCFSLNAAAFIGASQFAGRLGHRLGLARLLRVAVAGFATPLVLLAGLTAAGVDSLPVMLGLLFIGFAFVGLIMPSTSVLAMESHAPIAGAASALLGAIQMLLGSGCAGVVALFSKQTPLPMAIGIASCAVASWLIAEWVLRRQRAGSQIPAYHS
jgi:DHA1 family bicyclomycin/chloramphenicol resistance-like MFS transporter